MNIELLDELVEWVASSASTLYYVEAKQSGRVHPQEAWEWYKLQMRSELISVIDRYNEKHRAGEDLWCGVIGVEWD